MHRIPTAAAPQRLVAVDAEAAAVHRKVTACRQRPCAPPIPGPTFGDGLHPVLDRAVSNHRRKRFNLKMMEKVTRPNQVEASPASRTDPALSIIAALVWPLLVIFAAGYLTILLQVSATGAFLLDFNSRPVPVVGEWLPYLLRGAFVLLGLVAVLGYSFMCRTEAGRVVTLMVLVLAAFIGVYTLRPLPGDGGPHPIALFNLMYGAASPFTLALIGAVIVDLIAAGRRRRANPTLKSR